MLVTLALLAATPAPVHPTLLRLEGCWLAIGRSDGRPARGRARGGWQGERGYFALELTPEGAAGIPLGMTMAEVEPRRLIAFWTAVPDGLALPGKGQLSSARIDLSFGFPGARLVSRLLAEGASWSWTVAVPGDGGERIVGRYQLLPMACPADTP